MERFLIDVPEPVLVDLHDRLARTRWPEQIGEPWRYGTDRGYLRELCTYWRERFDWRAQEAALNTFDQFTTTIDGRRLHFIHQRSPEPGAKPLLLTHGWPGSVAEFRHVIGPLTDPVAHGGSAADAFHVVAPSIPGYGFSEAPAEPGFNGRACAGTFARLMAALGYERYFAQGGDWGSHISTWLAALEPERVAGIHLNLVFTGPPKDADDPMAGVTPGEAARLELRRAYMRNEVGYQHIQGTKPQTLGYGLNDSPAGLAAWIVEKFHGWTEHDGDLERAVSRDDMLTNVTLYWVTESITASMRLYFENRQHPAEPPVPERIEVPTAVAIFPGELYQPPRVWVERQYHLVHWSELPRGGHFAALEEPGLLVEDVRAAFRALG